MGMLMAILLLCEATGDTSVPQGDSASTGRQQDSIDIERLCPTGPTGGP